MSQTINLKVEYTSKLAQENEALKAQVERVREVINHYKEGLVPSDNAMEELAVRVAATPAQCLAEIKAQAGRDGFIAGVRLCDDIIDSYYAGVVTDADADEYANQLRQQGELK